MIDGPPVSPLAIELLERLERGEPGPFAIVVTFRVEVPVARLTRLGLYASSSQGLARIAYGSLKAEALRGLARAPDVERIAPIPVLPARPRASAVPAQSRKIAPELATLMKQQPGDVFPVIVTFSTPPGEAIVASLGLLATGPDLAIGRLTRAALLRLAERADVRRIELQPKVSLFGGPGRPG